MGDPLPTADRPPIYAFGPFRVDAESLQLTRDGEPIALPPKVFDVLVVLLRNRHRVVAKEELFRAVWRDVIVSEDSLTQTISAVRRALGDDRTHAEYIATMPRRGYRFVAPVTELEPPAAAPDDLRRVPSSPSPMPAPAPAAPTSRKRWLVPAALAISAAVIAALVATLVVRRGDASSSTPVYLSLEVPRQVTLTSGGFLSPAGDRVAFIAFDDQSPEPRIWLRTLSGPDARVLPGTEGASLPFWSPDGQQIGFFAGGKLKVLDTRGDIVRTLATIDGGTPSGGAWSSGGTILYAGWRSGLVAIGASGGEPRRVTTLDAAHNEAAHRRPQFLPDGRRFLYYVDSVDATQAGTYSATLEGGDRLRIVPSRAVFAEPGYLLYIQDRLLLAQRFDERAGRTTGDATRIIGNVENASEVSAAGQVLTFGGTTAGQLVWMDRQGQMLEPLNTPAQMHNPVFSPDGRYVAASSTEGDLRGVWLIDLMSGASTRAIPAANGPTWSPDGTQLAYYLDTGGVADIYRSPVHSTNTSEVVLRTREPKTVTDWSRRGTVYVTSSPESRFDLWLLPEAGKPMPLVRTPFNEMQGQWSPDGRWLAFASDESGSWSVYVQSFDAPSSKRAVSPGGGGAPRWRPDGRELFYIAPDRTLMSIDVKAGDTWDGARPQPLFKVPVARGLTSRRNFFAVTSDGQRFLFDADGTREPISVLVNWQTLASSQARD